MFHLKFHYLAYITVTEKKTIFSNEDCQMTSNKKPNQTSFDAVNAYMDGHKGLRDYYPFYFNAWYDCVRYGINEKCTAQYKKMIKK